VKILVDTNIFIAASDISPEGMHVNAELATELRSICNKNGVEMFVHPATRDDIRRTDNAALRRASELKLQQWTMLRRSTVRADLAIQAGYTNPLSENDQSDLELLAALESRSVGLLVTEDRKLLKRAAAVGLETRAIRLLGGIDYLKQLFGELVTPPTVESVHAYEISLDEAIFDSIRLDYTTSSHSFDDWFNKARREHRDCRVIRTPNGPIQGLAIYKVENDRPFGIEGKVLKLCTFKVAPNAAGAKRGELLLKATFLHANEISADAIYVTLFDEHQGLARLLSGFGFARFDELTPLGEQVFIKELRSTFVPPNLSALEFHVRYGPPAIKVAHVYVVPIKPEYHDVLFPEANLRPSVFGPEPSGNAILKAYLCQSVTNSIAPGDTLLFYRSHDVMSVTAIGVVESAERIYDPVEVRERVGFRTVYPDKVIRAMFRRGESVLTILFRHDRMVHPRWGIEELK
jgi:predicted nucleic acid-binding protein